MNDYDLKFFDNGMDLFRHIWNQGPAVQDDVFDNIKYMRTAEYDREIHFVAMKDSVIVGNVAFQHSPWCADTLWFMHIAVHDRHKGKGIARMMIEKSVEWAMMAKPTLEVSSFSEDGKERIRHIFEEQCLKYQERIKLKNSY